MMKRLIALTLCAVVLLLSLTACDTLNLLLDGIRASLDKTVETIPYTAVEPKELSYTEGYTPVESRYSYDALPLEGERLMYERLLKAYYDISPLYSEDLSAYPMREVRLEGYALSEAQVRTVMKAITDDCPEIFWMTGTIGYYSCDEYTLVQGFSKYSPDEIAARVDDLRTQADAFFATVPDGLTVFERELMVHDYLLQNTAYDTEVDKVDLEANHPDIYTAYGAMVNGKAVCEGYARAFQMLMNGLGVDCVGVIGTSENEMHIWNAVRMGDEWYNVDVTWDDQEEVYARYLYFNVTDEYLDDDHTPSPLVTQLSDDEINGSGEINADVMNLFIPRCTDNSMEYYRLKAAHLSDYDGSAVKTALLSAAEKQEKYFFFYIDESLDYDDTIALLFEEYPQYFFTYLSAVNNYLPDYSIDDSNLYYYPLSRCRTAAVELNYY